MSLEASLEKLARLDEPIGRNWFKHARACGAADDLLNVVIADGCFTTKIDGWIHAATLTTKSMAKFVRADAPPPLDLAEATAPAGGNMAVRYGRWQTDFHWKIDTRLWQYILYLKFMRDAYRDAIDESELFSGDERPPLQRLVTEFFDQAEIAMCYRWEFIERGRGFARHPDPTAGAANHGYTYRVVLPLPVIPFEELALELDPRAGPAGRESGRREIPAFPRLDGAGPATGLELAARAWLERAQAAGIADRWLRVRLGERMVATRFNGWETALEITVPSLARFADGGRAARGEGRLAAAFDLTDYAVRFGLAQAEFYRRLRGGASELIALLQAERQAIERHRGELPALRRATAAVDAFFTRTIDTVGEAFRRRLEIAESALPELDALRPLHPRFAPHDPLEPLPWVPKDPEAYRRKMASLGYVI
ncbi:MAG: hypothetical protein IT513_01775 [Burkholderiales bacterium]|nr:hypothetical protein [Burkholderiales bacterium]